MDSSRTKLVLATIFFLGCVALLYGRYQSVRPEALAERSREERRERRPDGERPPGAPREGRGGPGMMGGMGPTEEERKAMRTEMLDHLQVTPEQRAKLDEIEKRFAGKDGREVWRERMEAAAEVLTPEQQEKAREYMQTNMRARMEARMRERIKVLPPEEQEKFMRKFEERRGEMEARWRQRRAERRGEQPPAAPAPAGARAQ